MRLFARAATPPDEVVRRAGLARGDRVLASTRAGDGTWLLGTRDVLAIVRPAGETTTLPWQQVQAADWSRDDDRLRVSEVGAYGRPRPVHVVVLDDPGRLLELVRERVTASVVLQRRVVVRADKGLWVLARRAPNGTGPIGWAYELDAGLDPDDPEVRRLAELGVRTAAEELGLA